MKPTDLVYQIGEQVKDGFQHDRSLLSFDEYLALVREQPAPQLRNSAQYLLDVFEHYGSYEVKTPAGVYRRFGLFDQAFADGEGKISGQELVQNAIHRILSNMVREGQITRLILLHGPNGSAKSTIINAIMRGMEHYSRLPQGALYRFNWIFPTEKLGRTNIGFAETQRDSSQLKSYAQLPSDDIDARVPCEMHDHPLFLVPIEQRASFVQAVHGKPAHARVLREGRLCHKCKLIFDALLASYNGDFEKVTRHIQVERFYVSKRYRAGAVTIEPQLGVDAHLRQVTADRSLAALPKSLQNLALFEPAGALVDANRGLLEFNDLLKRPIEAFKYLLGTVETGAVSLDNTILYLDQVFIGSANEMQLDAFKEYSDFMSFKARIELVTVPYLTRLRDERAIYEQQLSQKSFAKHLAPHVMEVAALWATLTRLKRPDPALYEKSLGEVIRGLTPLDKVKLYDDGSVPEWVSSQQAKDLRRVLQDLYNESRMFPSYEGRYGASAREVRTLVLNAAQNEHYTCVSPLAVFDELDELVKMKSVYEFLRQDVVDGYHDHPGFVDVARDWFLDRIDGELLSAMRLAEESSYEELFSRYVRHVSHWVRREKLLDRVTGQYVDPDTDFMTEIESILLAPDEDNDDFRHGIIGTIGAHSLEHPGTTPDYKQLFPKYVAKLKENFFEQRKKQVQRVKVNFLRYVNQDTAGLAESEKTQVEEMLKAMKTDYGYCDACARDTIGFLLKQRYSA